MAYSSEIESEEETTQDDPSESRKPLKSGKGKTPKRDQEILANLAKDEHHYIAWLHVVKTNGSGRLGPAANQLGRSSQPSTVGATLLYVEQVSQATKKGPQLWVYVCTTVDTEQRQCHWRGRPFALLDQDTMTEVSDLARKILAERT